MEARLALLENKLKGTSIVKGSTAETEAPKRPVLIIGGWQEDQPASETLQKAKNILRQLDVPLDYSDIFAPGLKRLYAIVPEARGSGSRAPESEASQCDVGGSPLRASTERSGCRCLSRHARVGSAGQPPRGGIFHRVWLVQV